MKLSITTSLSAVLLLQVASSQARKEDHSRSSSPPGRALAAVRERVSPLLQRLSPFSRHPKDPEAKDIARVEAMFDAKVEPSPPSPNKQLKKHMQDSSKKTKRAKPIPRLERQAAFDDTPMPDGRKVVNLHEAKPVYKCKQVEKQSVIAEGPRAGMPRSGRKARGGQFKVDGNRVRVVPVEEDSDDEAVLASSPEPEALLDESKPTESPSSVPVAVQAFQTAMDRAWQAVHQAQTDSAHLPALKNALFLESPDAQAFSENFEKLSGAVAGIKTSMVDAFNVVFDALGPYQDFACSSEGSADWEEAWKAGLRGLSPLHDAMDAIRTEAEAIAELTSLDCYRLPFLRQDHHFLGDLDMLVKQYGMEADPALQAYRAFYGAIAAVNEAAEVVALGLPEMPGHFEAAVEYGEYRAFFEQRETLGAAWEQMQARLQAAREAVEAFGDVIERIEVDPEDADLLRRWQEEYQADAAGFAALAQSLEEEHLSLYQEYVSPSYDDLMIRMIDQAMKGKPAAAVSPADGALERAEALSIAMRVDAKLPRELFAELMTAMDEAVFVETLKALVGEKHWFDDKLAILRGRVEKVQAVTDEDKARLQSLRESIAAIQRGLPQALDTKALAQTALLKAHPDRTDAMYARMKQFDRDYIADEANDDEDVDADPIHEIYEERLYKHFVGLKNWEILKLQAGALEKAYHDVILKVPGSIEAFQSARKAFDRIWVPHAYAHQALQADFKALEEAIEQVDEARQRHWKQVTDNADALLQPLAFAALFNTSVDCRL